MSACVASSPSASPTALESKVSVALERNAQTALAEASTDVSTEAEISSDPERVSSARTQQALKSGSSPSEPDADVEAQKEEPPSAQAGDWCAKWRRPGLRRVCLIGGVLVVLILAALLTVFWPREPIWDLAELHMSEEVLNSFIAVTTGGATITDPLSFSASVNVFNPNLVSTTVDAGSFTLTYKGASMGGGRYDPIKVGARSSITVEVYLDLLFTGEVGQQIMNDALSNDFQIVVDADVTATAHVGVLSLNAAIQCHVTANTLEMLQDPNNVLAGHQCDYNFSL